MGALVRRYWHPTFDLDDMGPAQERPDYLQEPKDGDTLKRGVLTCKSQERTSRLTADRSKSEDQRRQHIAMIPIRIVKGMPVRAKSPNV